MITRISKEEVDKINKDLDTLSIFLQRLSLLSPVTYMKSFKYKRIGETTSSIFGYEYMVRDI